MSTTTCTDLIPVTVEMNGAPWALWRQSSESKIPLAKDLDVARWLGYSDPHMIRRLIDRYSDELGGVSVTATETGAQGGRPGRAYYLNDEQALFIAAKSDTPNANAVLKTMIVLFKKACAMLAGYEQTIADLRRQLAARPAPALRPTDIAAAWAKAYLEPAQEPMLVMDVWPRYVEWARDNGQPMPAATQVLAGGLSVHFHRVQRPTPRAAYFCALRSAPLPVELPAVQQSLPFEAAPRHDEIRAQVRAYFEGQGPRPMAETEMADLLDRVTRVLERNELEAAHVAEVLAAQPMPVQAVLGAGVETGRFTARAKSGRLLYRAVEREAEPQLTDIQCQVKAYMETRPEGERITTREVVEALGLTADKATEVRVGMALRSLGYQRDRRHDGSGWRRYFYSKPGQAN